MCVARGTRAYDGWQVQPEAADFGLNGPILSPHHPPPFPSPPGAAVAAGGGEGLGPLHGDPDARFAHAPAPRPATPSPPPRQRGGERWRRAACAQDAAHAPRAAHRRRGVDAAARCGARTRTGAGPRHIRSGMRAGSRGAAVTAAGAMGGRGAGRDWRMPADAGRGGGEREGEREPVRARGGRACRQARVPSHAARHRRAARGTCGVARP